MDAGLRDSEQLPVACIANSAMAKCDNRPRPSKMHKATDQQTWPSRNLSEPNGTELQNEEHRKSTRKARKAPQSDGKEEASKATIITKQLIVNEWRTKHRFGGGGE